MHERRETAPVSPLAHVLGRLGAEKAIGDVRALCIGQKQFEGMPRERPETSLAVMRVLCDRLRERETAAH